MSALLETLQANSRLEGFPLAGGVDIAKAHALFDQHGKAYQSWIQNGFQGQMHYLERGLDRRLDPTLLYPGAKSVFSVMLPYQPIRPESRSLDQPQFASYLAGPDYHEVIREKLERVLSATQKELSDGHSLAGKVCVDTSAVLERAWASFAGLGWIGKNSLLIHPKYGSYFFLGEILLNQELDAGPRLHPDYCGSCTRCLDACPTNAFAAPRVLNATRCISYWTLEKRGELELTPADQKSMGNWIAGCDRCQEVCPFSQKWIQAEGVSQAGTSDQIFETYEYLEQEDEGTYQKRVKHSALNRIKPKDFKRNLAIAAKNRTSR